MYIPKNLSCVRISTSEATTSCRMPGRPSPPQRAGGAAGAGGSPRVPAGELMGKPWENPWENGESMGKS